MERLLDFAGGPLFRLTFAIMVLGLLRVLLLDIWGMIEAYYRAGDKKIPWGLTILRTFEWIVPVKRVMHRRPVYSVVSILFHAGLLVVPIFLFAHVQLWESAIGIGWITLSPTWADILTITTIVFGLILLVMRSANAGSRHISRKQDYIWPTVLIVPFITGLVCSNLAISPAAYQAFMLVHILSAEAIFVMIPFTKIAHCVLMPLSQMVMVLAWKFPARVDDDVCETLGKKGAKV